MPVDTIISKHVTDPLPDAEVDRINKQIDKERDSYFRSNQIQIQASGTMIFVGIVVVLFNAFGQGMIVFGCGLALCTAGLLWYMKARSDQDFGYTGSVFRAHNEALTQEQIQEMAQLVEAHPAVAKVVLSWADKGLMPRRQHLFMLRKLAEELDGVNAHASMIDKATSVAHSTQSRD